ncbi:dicarboxylate/amino acid:cation symporter [Edaphosphingomonas haloaromaticamans]|uniref:Proton/sodium-glutamate symport protein n=1 Tax=Edaphosphingomonas haloaromaticamans TaxID=653954 RepID=A0A1S1H9N5_9SPHN|nr:dicarboxylate/amino acid:cation symporter [Sphingomonas haloaromaticamans]OHT18795.1 Proton/sodium-glutamate symport protein [Sphingomonas haloaromaticamans]
MSFMPQPTRARFRPSFGTQVLASMAIGVLLGLIARAIGSPDGVPNALAQTLATIGSIFVQLLKVLVPPLIFTAIVASIANFGEMKNAARLAGQTLLWFALTALIAVSIGLALGTILQPGAHAHAEGVTAAAHAASSASWLDFLKGLVPANILGLTAATKLENGGASTSLSINTLQIVVISIVIGIAALRSGEAAAPFLAFIRSLLAITRRILSWVIRLTPIGTIGLLGTAVAQYGWTTLAQLGAFAGAIYLGLAIVLLGVYPALLALNGLSPAHFFRTAWPAIQLGFVSRSSIGTLPVTEAVTERLGVPRPYAAFAVPLGATTKMDGCAAIYPAVASLFIAQFYGIALGPSDYLLIAFVSVIGSAATAGMTGAVVMLTLTLSTLGLPLEGIGLLLAIDPILDMGRTAVNVAGQALVPLIVSRREGMLEGAPQEDDPLASVEGPA